MPVLPLVLDIVDGSTLFSRAVTGFCLEVDNVLQWIKSYHELISQNGKVAQGGVPLLQF